MTIVRPRQKEAEDDLSIAYEIEVPAKTTVRLKTGHGSVALFGLTGPVDASVGSGSIMLDGIQGFVRAQTSHGSVTLLQTAAADAEITVGSGSIRVTGMKGSLRARTSHGSITVDGDPLRNWLLDVGSGAITLRLPQTARFDLAARAASGRLRIDHPLTVVMGELSFTRSRKEISGSVRGGGPRVELRTSHGNIRVE